MPDRTVSTTPPGVQNPYGTYIPLYGSHRMNEMYANAAGDYSVKGGSKKKATKKVKKKKTTKRKGY